MLVGRPKRTRAWSMVWEPIPNIMPSPGINSRESHPFIQDGKSKSKCISHSVISPKTDLLIRCWSVRKSESYRRSGDEVSYHESIRYEGEGKCVCILTLENCQDFAALFTSGNDSVCFFGTYCKWLLDNHFKQSQSKNVLCEGMYSQAILEYIPCLPACNALSANSACVL